MRLGKARIARNILVDLRIVLHRAGAERIESVVYPVIAARQLRIVTNQLELGYLWQFSWCFTNQMLRQETGDVHFGYIQLRQIVGNPSWLAHFKNQCFLLVVTHE
ncbi:Uncharacterised protein [Mycobacterium tuberculosis]|nr:Uncharacterised protein [Mycobacterium tuberculosis]